MSAASDVDSAGPLPPTQARGAGRASILVPVVLVALSAVAVLVWTLRSPADGPSRAAEPLARPDVHAAPAVESPALRYEIGSGTHAPVAPERTPREERPRADQRTRFAGTGVLEGSLRLSPGVSAPRAWSLVLEPSPVLIGGDRARARRVEFEQGELEFSIPDLPLGGYEVWAEAEGMSGRHEHLLLARPDAVLVYQDLRLVPLAFVEGRVLDDEGVGVARLPLFLRPLAGGARIEARADGGGHYLFERVPDGEYLLEAGFADASLAAPR
ncbi:MAG TPA: carboxypeptidase-like regulatory domain-containing protein, partial [Planctomycetota bacterium]|nr:carboxypeptidase-like regulatory domain-containing protein [Planctomycetota bacterium]